MWISEQKRQENIAEYILYMWQIEDIIRSYNLDLLKIEDELLPKFNLQEEQEDQLFEWYKTLINEMRSEGIANSGHLQRTKEVINQLFYLHQNLLNETKDFNYTEQYKKCENFLNELKDKSGAGNLNDIEIFFNGLYGKLLMKLQQKEISDETEDAFKEISKLISMLSGKYKKAFES